MTIYVVTAGCYSDYHIEAVFTNKEQAEKYANLDSEKEVEEYEADTVTVKGPLYVEVQYNPSENLIERITPIPERRWPHRDNMYHNYKTFLFQCILSERTQKDVEQHGKKSPLLLKAAQDRYARYRAEHMVEVEKEENDGAYAASVGPEEAAKMFARMIPYINAQIKTVVAKDDDIENH